MSLGRSRSKSPPIAENHLFRDHHSIGTAPELVIILVIFVNITPFYHHRASIVKLVSGQLKI